MSKYENLIEAVINGEEDKVKEEVSRSINRGDNPLGIISGGLTSAMSIVGQRMADGEMFIPEVLASAKAMKEGVELLRPLIDKDKLSAMSKGKVVLGTVQGDVHNLGKNLVGMMMESAGFSVIDIGENVMPEKFVEAVRSENADIVGLSSLLTTTMLNMKDVITSLANNNLRKKVKVMVGGAVVTQNFADSIGADAYASSAASAVEKAKQLLAKS